MANFMQLFPRIPYDIDKTDLSDYQIVTNITFRVGILREVLINAASYYFYTVKDGETPEILAENIYNNPEAYWIILYANDIYDPQYDWPMSTRAFKKYIINKYRSQAAASLSLSETAITDTQILSWTQDTTNDDSVHHYEKQIIRYNATDDVTMEINLEVNGTNVASSLNSTLENIPYDFYTSANTSDPRALEFAGSYETFNINGKTINQTIRGAAITYYDYENELNEKKRRIKVIKKEYYPQIITEFNRLTNTNQPFLRRLS
jgi:hypothetical protein